MYPKKSHVEGNMWHANRTNHIKGVRLFAFSILLIFSSHALAETIIQKLRSDASLQTESLRLIVGMMAKQKRLELPASALSEDDYQRLLVEIEKLRDEFYSPENVRLPNVKADELEKHLLNLSTRAGMLIDHMGAGYCNDSIYKLNLDTAKQSEGDWSIVKPESVTSSALQSHFAAP